MHVTNTIAITVVLFWATTTIRAHTTSEQVPTPSATTHNEVRPVVLVLAYAKTTLLRNTLRSLSQSDIYRLSTLNAHHTPSHLNNTFPIYVSIDDNPRAQRVIRIAKAEPYVTDVWLHSPPTTQPPLSARARISRHYAYALHRLFSTTSPTTFPPTHALIFEDDLLVARDSLSYLQASLHYIQSNLSPSSIVTASAWNDNGRAELPSPASLTSFFPGLGWVMSRTLWTELAGDWPCGGETCGGAPVATGWDFWLRGVFFLRDWQTIVPHIPRVRHVGIGVHVRDGDGDEVYGQTLLAGEGGERGGDGVSEREGELKSVTEWEEVLRKVGDVSVFAGEVRRRLREGVLVRGIGDAVGRAKRGEGGGMFVLPFEREGFEGIAERLRLWRAFRGHFRYTLVVELGEGDGELLLYDKRRAAAFFEVPDGGEDGGGGAIREVIGKVNGSCDEVCAAVGGGLVCDERLLDGLNDCRRLRRLVGGGCAGCLFETGGDLPAVVAVGGDVAVETAGWCLVTEVGVASGGRLDCSGRFRWTRRACACVPARLRHDEL